MAATLSVEKAVPFAIRPGAMTIALVGCGGNGSHIAQALARIAVHYRAGGGDPLRLVFIDGDTIEEKNVGRQLFTPAEIGRNKAQALAARFNHLFGLKIEAVPEMATVDVLRIVGGLTRRFGGKNDSVGLLVGAVDNAVARKSLNGALTQLSCWSLWLDTGNHDYSGQVSAGSSTDLKRLRSAIKLGICGYLPAPSVTDPELLEATERKERENCAAAIEDNLQGLMVNTQVAAIAAAYLDRIIIHRQLTRFRTSFSQLALSMRSLPITASTIAETVGSYEAYLQKRRAQEQEKAA